MPTSCGVAEETVWANRKDVKLKTKVLPRMENHVGAANGLSKKTNGDENELIGRIGQGIF